ncbi:hypothetical protein O7630_31660 [Micromonospora sp. WMMD718]|uniref:zinc finger domain-containing protein n=1 Tax=Micromonospora sp. WMMD718 TaxID=3016098 RepID=UPI00241728BE|nr:hypothetical protein [Micromonospora sp. WMMD718]MDG4755503.1 hypothetical protein [Micromonospora sp. WMMD718]
MISPFAISCPTCSAKAGQPCKVRKAAGTYRSPAHFQVFRTDRPLHQQRASDAFDLYITTQRAAEPVPEASQREPDEPGWIYVDADDHR